VRLELIQVKLGTVRSTVQISYPLVRPEPFIFWYDQWKQLFISTLWWRVKDREIMLQSLESLLFFDALSLLRFRTISISSLFLYLLLLEMPRYRLEYDWILIICRL
jgi:hypothetical protein